MTSSISTVPGTLSFAPGETQTFSVTWNQILANGNELRAGNYEARGVLVYSGFDSNPLSIESRLGPRWSVSRSGEPAQAMTQRLHHEHIVRINDPANPVGGWLTREQLWDGLHHTVMDPQVLDESIDRADVRGDPAGTPAPADSSRQAVGRGRSRTGAERIPADPCRRLGHVRRQHVDHSHRGAGAGNAVRALHVRGVRARRRARRRRGQRHAAPRISARTSSASARLVATPPKPAAPCNDASLLLVAFGGAIGSAARFQMSSWLLHQIRAWRFPLGTFSVNLLGCLIAGALGGLVAKQSALSPDARVFLLTGLLGGFTTFSAFGLETFLLLKRGEIGVALSYALLSVVAGLLGVWLGYSFVPLGREHGDREFGRAHPRRSGSALPWIHAIRRFER